WRALLEGAPKDAPWRDMVEKKIATDEAHLAGKPVAAAEPEAPAPQNGGGPSVADVAAAQNMTPADQQAMIGTMVQRLAARLDQDGSDLPGWLKLVRAYSVLDRRDDALKALERAKAAFSGNTEALQQLDQLAVELGLKS